MKSFARSVIVLLFFGGWCLSAAALHVIRTPGTVVIVPKNKLGIQDTYLDVRQWTVADMATHQGAVKRMVDSGNAGGLTEVVKGEAGATVEEQVINALLAAPTPKPVSAKPAEAAVVEDAAKNAPKLFK